MKFTVSMKDPDTLSDAIREAVTEEVDAMETLSEDEREIVVDARCDKVATVCGKWFEYGEYLNVEIDTHAETCMVIERN